METKVAVTLVIITNRADERLERAVACGKWFQQVVVVDNNSGADWKKFELALGIQITVHDYPHLIRDFSAVRNWALSNCPTDWVFFLDSDEYISKDSIKIIRQVIASETYDAAWCSRTDIFMGQELQHGEAGKHGIIRLMKKDKAKFVFPVHELAKVDGRTAITTIHIYHCAHQSLSQFIAKVALYAQLLGRQSVDNRVNLFQLLCFPPLKFIYNYIIRLGFLDGYPGLVYALLMSFHSFWVRVFRYEQTQHTP